MEIHPNAEPDAPRLISLPALRAERRGHASAETVLDRADGAEDGFSIVIPAHNEGVSIAAVIAATARAARRLDRSFEIVVVDDGSTDQTAEIAHQAGARVLQHPYNRGYGNALKSGIAAAKYEFVVICDGDGSYPIDQLPRLLEGAERFDMIVGARTGRHFFGSPFKRVGRWFQLRLVDYVTGIKVPDANSGFRLLRKSLALRYLDSVCSGFSFTTSITIALICEQCAVKFVPIDYHPRSGGKTHIRYFRDTLRSLQIVTHCVLRYNPLKAFLALAVAPLAAIPPLALFAPNLFTALLSSAACLCTAVLVCALGMVAYCVGAPGGGGGAARRVDAGVFSFVKEMESDAETPALRPAASAEREAA